MKIQYIEDFFLKNGGLVETKQLKEAGFTHYQLNNLISNGQVVKVKQGLYKWNDTDQDELGMVMRIVTQGVCCLFTACRHYELTTFVSSEYHLAIPKKAKVVLPDYPPIKLYYWDKISYATGITQTTSDGFTIPMYDVEKTVCDMVRLRNKVGMDTVKEVMQAYLKRKDRNLAKLSNYARVLGIGTYISDKLSLLL
jgi:predicted transcriptional regulator of viral defense system